MDLLRGHSLLENLCSEVWPEVHKYLALMHCIIEWNCSCDQWQIIKLNNFGSGIVLEFFSLGYSPRAWNSPSTWRILTDLDGLNLGICWDWVEQD